MVCLRARNCSSKSVSCARAPLARVPLARAQLRVSSRLPSVQPRAVHAPRAELPSPGPAVPDRRPRADSANLGWMPVEPMDNAVGDTLFDEDSRALFSSDTSDWLEKASRDGARETSDAAAAPAHVAAEPSRDGAPNPDT